MKYPDRTTEVLLEDWWVLSESVVYFQGLADALGAAAALPGATLFDKEQSTAAALMVGHASRAKESCEAALRERGVDLKAAWEELSLKHKKVLNSKGGT